MCMQILTVNVFLRYRCPNSWDTFRSLYLCLYMSMGAGVHTNIMYVYVYVCICMYMHMCMYGLNVVMFPNTEICILYKLDFNKESVERVGRVG